ncbi:MAG: hypothetical protein ACLPTZ_18925 [Beijerinckiaceae bacterium]
MSARHRQAAHPRRAVKAQVEMLFVPPGMRVFGHWTEIGSADRLRKRIIVRCRCGRTATVALEALASGESTSCGCRPPHSSTPQAAPSKSKET